MQATVGIVTIAFRSSATLEPFLRSVRADPQGADAPIVIVDNDHEDPAVIRRLTDDFSARWAPAPQNRGYGAGANLGVSLLPPTDFVLISNPDVVVNPGAIERMIRSATEDPTIGSVGPRIMDPAGEVYPSARALPSLRVGIGHALLGRSRPDNRWSRRYHHDSSPTRRTAGWLSGSFLLLRRDAFTAVGGFDESYFMYFEDVDLGARLGEAGWKNLYEPAAKIVHLGGHSTATQHNRMLIEHHRSAYRYLARRYRGWYLAPLRLALRIGLGARALWITRGAKAPRRNSV